MLWYLHIYKYIFKNQHGKRKFLTRKKSTNENTNKKQRPTRHSETSINQTSSMVWPRNTKFGGLPKISMNEVIPLNNKLGPGRQK